MPKLTLTTKISVMTSLLVAGVLSVMVFCTYLYLERQFMNTTARQQDSLVSLVADEIDSKLLLTQRQLVALAGTVRPELFQDPVQAERYLRLQPDELETFDNGLFLLDAQGTVIASNPPRPQINGGNMSYREYFQKTVQIRKSVISEPFLSLRRKLPIIVITAPIYTKDRHLVGMLCGSLDLLKANYLGKLAEARFGERGYFFLMNQNRDLLVHPDRSRILKHDVPPGGNRLVDAALAGFEGTSETVNTRGVPLISSCKRLKTNGWILVGNTPQVEAYAPLNKAKWYLFSALVSALCFTALATRFAMRQLSAPLFRFTRHVEAITGLEQEPEPVRIASDDEIGTLAAAFNRMVHEVHRQKRAALEQEAFRENLIQNSSVATYVLDREHRIIIWNRALEELTGVSAERMLGTREPWRPFYPAARPVLANLILDETLGEVDELYGVWGRSLLNAEGLYGEGWFRELNGRERFLCFDAAPIHNAAGEVIAVIETLRDITERKQAEESLQKLSLAVEQIPVTVMITDPRGVIEYVNPNFTAVTGYRPEEVVGRNASLVRSSWHYNDFFRELWQTILAGRVWRGELRNKKKNGELYWEAASITPLKGEKGEIRYFVAVKEDVTERRRAEEQLRQATAAAEAATRAKSQFLANMSHEIRTPINAAIGMLYLLQQTELSAAQKGYLEKAKSASNLLLRVINDILDFSKIEAGRLELECAPFSLASVLQELCQVASATVKEKPVELRLACGPEVPEFLSGDSLRLSQVLLNLMSNAIKFTEKGVVELAVDLLASGSGRSTLRFTVTDTGIGMTPEQQERLFSAFSQADASTTRRYGGTGLGLSISAQLVELMGGVIRVGSEAGQGSAFSFVASFATPSEEERLALAEQLRCLAPGAAVVDGCRGMCILLVEDNPINQEVACELLERQGARVVVAGNGAEALERLSEPGSLIHAVLMDVQMPVMDGLEATRRIRENPAWAELPVIAMTASALLRERELCREAGMNDQVTKPIIINELVATLLRWIPAAQLPAEPALPGAGTQETAGGLPERLPGLDLRRALATLESPALLRKLLQSFRKENLGLMDDIAAALAEQDLTRARRLVHTVKGVAGNLGALELARAARELEPLLGRDAAERAGALELLHSRLEELFASALLIGTGDPAQQPAPAPRALDLEQLGELCRRLASLLKADNLNALGVWEELKPQLPAENAARLEGPLEALDFQLASKVLDEVALDLEVAL
ncbi:PAS domain S-box protein [Geomonas silvestris]|nr:PAS domain S-box protein [Geomonas silvestris]